MKFIQASILGFDNIQKPATVRANYNEELGILQIQQIMDSYQFDSEDNVVFISNDKRTNYDIFFENNQLHSAIEAFNVLNSPIDNDNPNERFIRFHEKAILANPQGIFQVDKITMLGKEYVLAELISNAKVATLAICFYVAQRSDTIDFSLDSLRLNPVFNDLIETDIMSLQQRVMRLC